MPEVSVILPYYNAANTLKAAAESILQQSFHDFELLLVNNASTDGSLTVARQLALTDTRIRLLNEDKPGVVMASKTGFLNAKGRYIARMDADDLADAERLSLQVNWLEKRPACGGVGSQVTYLPFSGLNGAGLQRYIDWTNRLITAEEIFANRFIELPIVNPSLMLRKGVIDQLGYYQEGDFPEDYEFILRLLNAGVLLEKVPEKLLFWRDSPSRLTRKDARYQIGKFYEVKARYLAAWLQRSLPPGMPVWVWGAGKASRKRAMRLEAYGQAVAGFVDVKPRKVPGKACVHFSELLPVGQVFVLAYVGNWGAREEIKAYLQDKGYQQGVDFLLAA